MVSGSQYQQIKKNILDYRKLIDEHRTLQGVYIEVRDRYQTLLTLYSRLDSLNNTGEQRSIKSLKIEIERMKLKIVENNKTIKKLNSSYQFCRDDLVRYKAKRTIKKLNKFDKN